MTREKTSHTDTQHLEGARYPDNLLKDQHPAASWEMLITTLGTDTTVRYLLGVKLPHSFMLQRTMSVAGSPRVIL